MDQYSVLSFLVILIILLIFLSKSGRFNNFFHVKKIPGFNELKSIIFIPFARFRFFFFLGIILVTAKGIFNLYGRILYFNNLLQNQTGEQLKESSFSEIVNYQFKDIFSVMYDSVSQVITGFNILYNNSVLFYGLAFILYMLILIRRKKWFHKDNGVDISFFNSAIVLSNVYLVLMLVTGFIFFKNTSGLNSIFIGILIFFAAIFLFFWVSVTFTFIETLLIEKIHSNHILNIFKDIPVMAQKSVNLLKFNFIISLLTSITLVYRFISQVGRFVNAPPSFFEGLESFSFFRIIGVYFGFGILVLTIVMPLILLIEKDSLGNSFKRNIHFIRKNITQYFSLIVFFAVLYIPVIVFYDFMPFFRLYFLYWSIPIELLLYFLQLSFVFWVTLSFYNFYMKYREN